MVPILFVECWYGTKRVARAGLSATWAGIIREGETEVQDITQLLVAFDEQRHPIPARIQTLAVLHSVTAVRSAATVESSQRRHVQPGAREPALP
jgi:hypothetical protein